MSIFLAGVILLMGVLLLWIGIQVERGKRRPKPGDKFLPLFGRNIDYVMGTAGIMAGLGLILAVMGFGFATPQLAGAGAVLIIGGIVRAYLPPKHFGPGWARTSRKKF